MKNIVFILISFVLFIFCCSSVSAVDKVVETTSYDSSELEKVEKDKIVSDTDDVRAFSWPGFSYDEVSSSWFSGTTTNNYYSADLDQVYVLLSVIIFIICILVGIALGKGFSFWKW